MLLQKKCYRGDCQLLNGYQSEYLYLRTPSLFYRTGFFINYRDFFRYNSTDAVGDLVAGITVGLTVIPQALAYSGIAGLPAAVSYKNCLLISNNVFLTLTFSLHRHSMDFMDHFWVVLFT